MDSELIKAYDKLLVADQTLVDAMILTLCNKDTEISRLIKHISTTLTKQYEERENE